MLDMQEREMGGHSAFSLLKMVDGRLLFLSLPIQSMLVR